MLLLRTRVLTITSLRASLTLKFKKRAVYLI